ncbi:unnamed protein product [Coffea canephora]|uniref:Disease resistance protein RGA3 n=1 Tax=Coffea canephora TaxID=49390 RepID=A0A068U522_COFCA|nr:unnamed protein product [Coffea canephora]
MAGALVDALLGSTTEVLVEKAINLASEQIGQFVGFKKDLEKLKDTLTGIRAFLRDAEKKQVTEDSVTRWLEELERVAFDADNLLDDINYEMIRRKVEIRNQMKRKVCLFFSVSNPIAFRCRMAKKIQKINMDLTSIHERRTQLGLQSQNGVRDAPALSPPSGEAFMKDRETDSVTVGASFVGRDDDVSSIVTQLTATCNNETLSVHPIVGLGGIGKTTVAQKVFNDSNIKNHFDKRMWVCVSDIEKKFDANKLFGLMLEKLGVPMAEVAGMDSREAKVQKLKEMLDSEERNGKKSLKYLLVLDDVWNEDPASWNRFLDSLRGISSANGSWILVTTRNEQVATITTISSRPCSLEKLSDHNCWLILEKKAFGSRETPDDLKELGLELAKKCQGLPLAATVLGGMLCNKGSDVWRSILETGLQNIGGDGDSYITKILKLSFDHLPDPSLKKCFAYCSIFPQDFQMERNQLIQLWAAEGFLHSDPRKNICMEEVGNGYFTILLDSNLFQDAEKDDYGNVLYCKMHDLVHDMLQSISDSKTLRLKESTEADFHDKTFRSIDDGLIIFLACLRVLSIASSNAKELPKSIGKLSHLRYLDSSNTPIETLPDSLCKLYNLQTLRLRDCESLRKFPNNFKNLVNLRHFDFFYFDSSSDLMPLEIGQLRSLQTLPFFNTGKEAGRQIGELRNLKHLSGQLVVRNLELVRSKEEAESANLIGKPNIDELILLWNEIDTSRNNDSEYNQVLEGLQAHQNLKGLIIERFFGDKLSTWIGKLGKLVKFELQDCKNCKELPTLGNMPLLRSLHLEGLDSLTSIGPSFYGGSGMHGGSSSQRALKLFPALEYLNLEKMQNLSEWTEATVDDGTVVVFPVLHAVWITDCPQLATFPNHFPCLETLNIENTQNGSSLMTYICSGELRVNNCNNLISFPIDLTRTPSLFWLDISLCEKLTNLPKGKLCSLTSLRYLYIGPFSETTTELHSFLDLFDALPAPHPYFPSVSWLLLYGWPHWESLPAQLQHLFALTTLGLYGFGVKSLPDWFGKLSSLEELQLSNCRKLENLPSHQSMRSLTRLRKLWITHCPLLKERCDLESSSTGPNSERSKISHIHYISIS